MFRLSKREIVKWLLDTRCRLQQYDQPVETKLVPVVSPSLRTANPKGPKVCSKPEAAKIKCPTMRIPIQTGLLIQSKPVNFLFTLRNAFRLLRKAWNCIARQWVNKRWMHFLWGCGREGDVQLTWRRLLEVVTEVAEQIAAGPGFQKSSSFFGIESPQFTPWRMLEVNVEGPFLQLVSTTLSANVQQE